MRRDIEMKNILYIMLGGAIGAALRYLVGLGCSRIAWTSMPLGTLTVNLVGCFLLGLLMALGQRYTSFAGAPYLMLTVGVCGAFTTFSTFSADTIRLVDNGQWLLALGYLTLSIVGGFVLFYMGRKIII